MQGEIVIRINHIANLPKWHLTPCGEIVDYVKKKGIRGFVIKNGRKADLNSVIGIFILQIRFGDNIEIEFDKDEGFLDFIKNF